MERSANFITVIIVGLVVSFMPDGKPPETPPRQPEKLAIQKQEASPPKEAPAPVETVDVATVSPNNQQSPIDEILSSLDGWVKSIEVVADSIPDPPENMEDALPAGEQESPELPGESIEPKAPSPPGSVLGDIPTVKVKAVGPDNRYAHVEMEAWGVHIGNGRVATVPHIIEPAQYGFRIQSLFVDGKPSRLYRHPNHKIDFGLASSEHLRDDNKYPPFRRARYLERVTIHAMKSNRLMRGRVSITSPEWILSLDEDEPGVIQGDSGSPIVSESGELIGLVSGYKSLDDKDDHRVVAFVPIYELEMPGFAKAASGPADSQQDIEVIEVGATWCVPCQRLTPIIEKLQAEGLPIRRLDERDAESATYRVGTYPTFIVKNRGREVIRYFGSISEDQLRRLATEGR